MACFVFYEPCMADTKTCTEVDVDRYRIELHNSRAQIVSADQLRRIARGLGDQVAGLLNGAAEALIVEALHALPPTQRADALSVAMLRFGDKQDLESISQACGLNPWHVWQLERAFRDAISEAE